VLVSSIHEEGCVAGLVTVFSNKNSTPAFLIRLFEITHIVVIVSPSEDSEGLGEIKIVNIGIIPLPLSKRDKKVSENMLDGMRESGPGQIK
jgi:hypothetical protein